MSLRGNNHLLWAILAGALAGILTGWYFGPSMLAIKWLGDLFLNALKMTIIPLIVAAVITGVTSMGDVRKLGRVGGLTIIYYASTTALAVLIGLLVVNLIQPGGGITELSTVVPDKVTEKTGIGFQDIILSLVNPNLIQAAAETKLLPIIVFSLFFAAALTTIGERNACCYLSG